MAAEMTFSEADEGKRVADANGRAVGRIVEVQGGVAYLLPDASVAEAVAGTLGWTESIEADAHPLRREHVATVGRDEIRLSQACF